MLGCLVGGDCVGEEGGRGGEHLVINGILTRRLVHLQQGTLPLVHRNKCENIKKNFFVRLRNQSARPPNSFYINLGSVG
jgi:hypothetical protein